MRRWDSELADALCVREEFLVGQLADWPGRGGGDGRGEDVGARAGEAGEDLRRLVGEVGGDMVQARDGLVVGLVDGYWEGLRLAG